MTLPSAARVVVAPAVQYKENLYNRAFARGKQANRPYGRGKTIQPRLWRDGNPPLLPTAPPPEGEVLAALYNELLKLAQGEAESRLPPPGWQRNWICRGSEATRKSSDMLPFRRSTAVGGDRGAFPRAKRGCTAFVAKGSAAAKRRYPPLNPAACGGL